jgi:hypothetical protein
VREIVGAPTSRRCGRGSCGHEDKIRERTPSEKVGTLTMHDRVEIVRHFAVMEWHLSGPADEYDPGAQVSQSDGERWAWHCHERDCFEVRQQMLAAAGLIGISEDEIIAAEEGYRAALLRSDDRE